MDENSQKVEIIHEKEKTVMYNLPYKGKKLPDRSLKTGSSLKGGGEKRLEKLKPISRTKEEKSGYHSCIRPIKSKVHQEAQKRRKNPQQK